MNNRAWWGVAVLCVLLVGCSKKKGGIEYGDPIPDEQTFTSSDGLVTLVAPAGTRLPKDGIEIEVVDVSTLPASLLDKLPTEDDANIWLEHLLGFEMRPDGATFDPPLRVSTIVTPPDPIPTEAVFRITTLEGGEPRTLMNPALLDPDDGTLLVSADVSHFSPFATTMPWGTGWEADMRRPDNSLMLKDAPFSALMRVHNRRQLAFHAEVTADDFNTFDCVDSTPNGTQTLEFAEVYADTQVGTYNCKLESPTTSCGLADADVKVRVNYLSSELFGDYVAPLSDRGYVRCTATGITDPADFSTLPALDVRGALTGISPTTNHPWIRIQMDGLFPPPDTVYSWYISVEYLDSQGQVVAAVYYQRHAGVSQTIVQGALNGGDAIVTAEGSGIVLELQTTLPTVTDVRITTGFEGSQGDPIQTDVVPATATFVGLTAEP